MTEEEWDLIYANMSEEDRAFCVSVGFCEFLKGDPKPEIIDEFIKSGKVPPKHVH